MGIGSFLKREVKGFVSGITAQDGVQDWSHAAKVFAAEDMLRSPKFKGMFHVSFVFNTEALNSVDEAKEFAETIGSQRNADVLSVLTKSIDLPGFTIDHTIHNQYNKPTIAYKKIKYKPVSVTFHDDMSDIVWAFWAFYYNWYFADGTKYLVKAGTNSSNKMKDPFFKLIKATVNIVTSIFKKNDTVKKDVTQNQKDEITTPKPGAEWDAALRYPLLLNSISNADTVGNMFTDAWGLNGSVYHSSSVDKNFHLLKQIEIYPLGQKQASMIVLHNPKIVGWDHDTFDYSQSATATCKMEIAYEGVSYMDQVSAASILESVRFYDEHSSPLMRGAPRSLLGPGGLLDRAEGIIGNIMKGKPKLSDLISAIGIAKTITNKKFAPGVKAELKTAVTKGIESAAISAVNNKIFPNKSTTKNGG